MLQNIGRSQHGAALGLLEGPEGYRQRALRMAAAGWRVGLVECRADPRRRGVAACRHIVRHGPDARHAGGDGRCLGHSGEQDRHHRQHARQWRPLPWQRMLSAGGDHCQRGQRERDGRGAARDAGHVQGGRGEARPNCPCGRCRPRRPRRHGGRGNIPRPHRSRPRARRKGCAPSPAPRTPRRRARPRPRAPVRGRRGRRARQGQ